MVLKHADARDTAWAMSQENVELARRWYASVPDDVVDDREWIDAAFRDYLDEGFEFHLPRNIPRASRCFGAARD
jgi:hypothetical protein